MNGFQLENTTTSYGLLKIDNANNMSLSLFSADNINFKMNNNNNNTVVAFHQQTVYV